MKNPLYPCLWYNQEAKEAASFYCSIFPNSSIQSENPMVVIFHLNGTRFMALNGGPEFQFNESISWVIECDTQEEIDHYWDALTDGGEPGRCGWLKDRYGMSWQVVPSMLGSLMNDPQKGPKVVEAFMKMNKFIIADLML